jgi:hypothetical protein
VYAFQSEALLNQEFLTVGGIEKVVFGILAAKGDGMNEFCKVSDAETRHWNEALARNTEREMANFKRMLPGLLLTDRGRFVAVSEGKLVDKDSDEIALAERVTKVYEGKFVLIQKVVEIPLDDKKTHGVGRS